MFWMAIGVFGQLALEVMNIVGAVVTVAWLNKECGWGVAGALIGGLLLSHIPIVGTILAIIAVVQTWQWNPLLAIIVFCWHWVFFVYCVCKSEKN